MDINALIDKYYPAGTLRRDIFLKHSRSVADKAVEIADRKRLDLDRREIRQAAMLHDIGIFLTDAPGIDCHGEAPYIAHGTLGAELLRENGFDERYARVAERHTGAGITAADIARFSLPIPPHDLMPESLLERLVCYADKFYSKSGDMKEKTLERVRASMERFGGDSLRRFDRLHAEFGD